MILYYIYSISTNIRWLLTHLRFFLYYPIEIIKYYVNKLISKILKKNYYKNKLIKNGYNYVSTDHIWELYFKIDADDTVLDIGSWPGSFAKCISSRSKNIICIEAEKKQL